MRVEGEAAPHHLFLREAAPATRSFAGEVVVPSDRCSSKADTTDGVSTIPGSVLSVSRTRRMVALRRQEEWNDWFLRTVWVRSAKVPSSALRAARRSGRTMHLARRRNPNQLRNHREQDHRRKRLPRRRGRRKSLTQLRLLTCLRRLERQQVLPRRLRDLTGRFPRGGRSS